MHTTPISLLKRLKDSSDQTAWFHFVELYTPLLFAWTQRVGIQEADAADLLQDVLLLLVNKLPDFTYDPDKSFRGWLRTILVRKWLERERRADPVAEAAGKGLPDVSEPDGVAEFWETEYRDFLAARALKLMQAEFHRDTWRAFWEYVTNGRSAAEVAAELGITVNAVYIAKSRVLVRLRQELEGLLD